MLALRILKFLYFLVKNSCKIFWGFDSYFLSYLFGVCTPLEFSLLLLFSLWQVFLDDKERPGRYKLAAEQPSRPYPDDLDVMVIF